MTVSLRWLSCLAVLLPSIAHAQTPLHQRIDAVIKAGYKGPVAKAASDDEFLRRVYLDFTGTIPSADEARKYLADTDPQRRVKLIDRLLASPDYPRRMQEFVHVMLEERRENKESPLPAWEDYLLTSFAENKPWDQLAREILSADGKIKAANKFYIDRAGDNHLITRDVGRLFLGRDLECARCHDHPTVKDFSQAEYFGLYAFLHRTIQAKKGGETVLSEKYLPGKLDFESVFTMEKGMIGPRLIGGKELVEPVFAKGEEYVVKPEPKKGIVGELKYSPRAMLATELAKAQSRQFVRNAANRLWFMLLGRGVVHPLDLDHKDNKTVHPKLLDLLAGGLVELKFDTKAFLREVALTQAYQRSSLVPGSKEIPEGSFAVAELRGLSPEQLLYSVARSAGVWDELLTDANVKADDAPGRAKALRTALATQMRGMVQAFGGRAGEAEVEFQPSLAGALFLSNEKAVLTWFVPKGENLVGRLDKLASPEALAEELYLSVLTRRPTAEEKAEVADHLKKRGDARTQALQELTWALIASTEFRLNH